MIQIKKTQIIKQPLDKIWNVIYTEFTDVGKWVTGVYKSRAGTEEESCDRVCDTFTGKLYEKIVDRDEANHSFLVDVKGLPSFVAQAQGGWSLKKIDENTTEANFHFTAHTKGIIGMIMQIPMKFNLNKAVQGTLDDMSNYINSGQPSQRKQAELNKKKE